MSVDDFILPAVDNDGYMMPTIHPDDLPRFLAEMTERKLKWQDDLRRKAVRAIHNRRSQRTIRHRFDDYAFSLNSEERLPRLIGLLAELEPSTFWTTLGKFWSLCDATWEQTDGVLSLMRQHGAVAPARKGRIRKREIRVYRGCSRPRVRGISWTTDQEIACGFARGHRHIAVPDPVVASASVFPSHLFVRIDDREEHEVLLDPATLFEIEVQEFP